MRQKGQPRGYGQHEGGSGIRHPVCHDRATIGLGEVRSADHAGGRACLKQTALMDQPDVICGHRGEVQIMQDHDHTAAASCKAAQYTHHADLVGNIKARDRLVQKQSARPPVQHRLPDLHAHPRQLHPRLLAA